MNKNKNKNKNNKNEEPLNKQFTPQSEERVLEFWENNKIFEKSMVKRKGKKEFVFYEGPPYCNGRPGIHHVEARSFKDIILRYKTMAGYFVSPRRAGWDTHGLPTEMEVEKKLGIKSKKQIEEEIGIEKFVEEARENVFLYKDEWEKMTKRIAYWIDLNNPYVTMDNYYIENLWTIIKSIYERGLFFEDYKVLPWCARCGTALSHHEVAQGYKTTTDLSVIVKFQITNDKLQINSNTLNYEIPSDCRLEESRAEQSHKNKVGDCFALSAADKARNDDSCLFCNSKSNNKTYIFILAWTTTPWTLPGNVALAVNENITYSAIKTKNKDEVYILAKDRLDAINEEYEILKEFKGKDLIGAEYKPLFDISELKNEKSYKVYNADFVNTEDGTGVVHTAVMYGDDDYKLGKKIGLPMFHTVTPEGKFIASLKNGLSGMFVKSKETEGKIINYLKENGLLLLSKEYSHDYPFCWRCQSPLLYYAKNSWFFKTTGVRQKMIKENDLINWNPSYLKKGRFGEWLRDVRDWAVSRERYWGAPLPVWKCENGHIKLIGNIHELKAEQIEKKEIYIMRHGESDHNKNKICDGSFEKTVSALTKKGIKEIEKTAANLKKAGVKFDLILSSDFLRTKQTAELMKKNLEIPEIVFDPRLREISAGIFEGKKMSEYHKYFNFLLEKFEKKPPEGESLNDLKIKAASLLKDINGKYNEKRILVVSHEYPLWILSGVSQGFSNEEIVKLKLKNKKSDFIATGEAMKLKYSALPINREGNLDLHRPYIDEIKIKCGKCGGEMKRILEVADVWFDSGAMPLAQNSKFSADNKNSKLELKKLKKKISYPADYICEAIDQTRGWFYTLLAVSSLLDLPASFKNVISLGLVLDDKGQKMSKSRGNTVNPWEMIEKYGVDSVRWYFYTINQPWDDKLFKEKDLQDAQRKFINLFWNSYVYYKTYELESLKKTQNVSGVKPKLIINEWVTVKFNKLVNDVVSSLDKYDIVSAARFLENFLAEDISHWYIRRIRDIFKDENSNEAKETRAVFSDILRGFSILAAPFIPYISEEVYSGLNGKMESVHFEDYIKPKKVLAADKKLIENMEEARKIVSLALEERAKIGIKVRQPLALLKIKSQISNLKSKELLELIKGEVNIKEIVLDKSLENEIWLDAEITPELREEGFLRDITRAIQDLRKKSGLTPKDRPVLLAYGNDKGFDFIIKYSDMISKETNFLKIEIKSSALSGENSASLKTDDVEVEFGVEK